MVCWFFGYNCSGECELTTRIFIPAKAVLENKSGRLDLVHPSRCSRCDAEKSSQFESHPLNYEAGFSRFHTYSHKFRSRIKFNLRLPLCETCYQVNFIENPDSCDHDATRLGRIAHWRSSGIITASLIACLAFILLMKIIPLPAATFWTQWLWLILMGVALILFGIFFGLTEIINRQIRHELVKSSNKTNLRRADVFAKMQMEDPQPQDVAVTATLQNDSWAEECAAAYGWAFERIESDKLEKK